MNRSIDLHAFVDFAFANGLGLMSSPCESENGRGLASAILPDLTSEAGGGRPIWAANRASCYGQDAVDADQGASIVRALQRANAIIGQER